MITVVIPTRERAHLLDLALRSLAEQTYRDFEVVVVNDGGPSLHRALARWRRELSIRLVELDGWYGVSRARNVGVAAADGAWIAFLDDDDVFLPEHLESARRVVRDTHVDLVYLGALVSDRRLSRLPADLGGMHRKAYQFNEDFLLAANYIHTGSVLVRNFSDTPVRFDETLTHCEDWDLWLALRWRLGYRFGFEDRITSIYHQMPGTSGLVAQAQATTPSPFSIAREKIHAKWPSVGPVTTALRRWLTAFEAHRNARISGGLPIPHQLFDDVLLHLHTCLSQARLPSGQDIPDLFEGRAPRADRPRRPLDRFDERASGLVP